MQDDTAPDGSDPVDDDNIDDEDILPAFGPRLTLDESVPAPAEDDANIVNFTDLAGWDVESNVRAINLNFSVIFYINRTS